MIKRMQLNLILNDNVHYENKTHWKGIKNSIFVSYDSSGALASVDFKKPGVGNEIPDEDNERESEEEEATTHSLEECQIWIPIKDKLFVKDSKSRDSTA